MKLIKSVVMILAAILMAPAAHAALPSVKVKDMKGRTVDTANLSNGGKPMIITFFAGWCKPCRRELNAIAEVYADWQEETGVKIVAISIDKAQDSAKVKQMVAADGWEYEILLDPNGDFMRAMGIQQIPHLLILNGNGKIVESRSGYTDGSENHIIEKLREILKPAPVNAKSPARK